MITTGQICEKADHYNIKQLKPTSPPTLSSLVSGPVIILITLQLLKHQPGGNIKSGRKTLRIGGSDAKWGGKCVWRSVCKGKLHSWLTILQSDWLQQMGEAFTRQIMVVAAQWSTPRGVAFARYITYVRGVLFGQEHSVTLMATMLTFKSTAARASDISAHSHVWERHQSREAGPNCH